MALQVGRAVLILVVGLFVGGIIASFGVAAAPPAWRGPWIPLAGGVSGILVALLVSRLNPPGGAGTRGASGEG